jgi:hypothetical protein
MSKIKPKGVTPQKTGAVFTCNDPLKFNKGNTGGSRANGVSVGPTGVTTGSPHPLVSTPNANKSPPATKVTKSRSVTTKLSGTGLKGF